jgi:hypothetical protein
MSVIVQNKNKLVAIAITIAVHALLFLLFVLTVFITPLPPFEIKPTPEIELSLGMEGFGNSDPGGSGENDPEMETTPVVATSAIDNSTSSAPNVITDDTEESVSVKTTPEATNKPKATTTAPKVEEQKPSKNLLNALARLKSKKKHVGKGEGTGKTGGSGSGTNEGIGGSNGTGRGNSTPGGIGIGDYDLTGRQLVKKAQSMSDTHEEGIVVVEIIVNQYGKVIKAIPGQRGSTTTSANLYAKARQAALNVKFNPSDKGIKEQRGTYTFVFILE